jgi:PD-(D/E)XK endonuclease
MFDQKNTKMQGNVGIGAAIAYFAQQGYGVSIPLTDSFDYDLVVDINGTINRVQVKTTKFKSKYGVYSINLSVKGGNRSFNTIKKFDNTKVDSLFVLTEDGSKYFIPSSKVKAKGQLNLGSKYVEFKV